MANPIQSNDLANKDVFKNLTDGAKELIGLIDKLTAETKQFGTEAEKVAKSLDFKKSSDIAKVNKLLEELTKNTDNLTKAQKSRKQASDALTNEEKERLKIEQKLNEAQKAQGRESERLKVILTEQRRVNRELAKDQLNQNKTYRDQSRTLISLRKRYKDLAVQNKENTAEGRKLLRQITALDARLKAIDASVGQSQRNVGNYSSAFKGLGSQLGGFIGLAGGVAGAIAAISAGVRASISLFSEYGLAIAKVKAISGASEAEFERLDKLAKDLGESTAFTASQVATLELELSKLGFDPKQIEDSTQAILNFAVATDSDLGRAGKVVASTLNAFNLEASEAARVADVAALAFSSSALDIEKFETALSVVGATSNAAGVSLEETTAVLGVLVDAGIDASSAATGLRKVLAVSANEGRNYKDVLLEIVGDTNQLSKANELFGLTAQSQAVTVANNIDKIDELTESFQNAEGSAQAASDIIGDTLDGDIKRLQSAIQGATLDNEEFQGTLRKIVQFLTKFLPPIINFISATVNEIIEFFKPVGELFVFIFEGLESLGKALGFTSKEGSTFKTVITTLLLPLKAVNELIKLLTEGIKSLGNFIGNVFGNAARKMIDALNITQKRATATTNAFVEVGESVRALQANVPILQSFAKAVKENFDEAKNSVVEFAKRLKDGIIESGPVQDLIKIYQNVVREAKKARAEELIENQAATVKELNEQIKIQNELINQQNSRKEIADIQAVIKKLEAKRDALLGVNKAKEKEIEFNDDEFVNREIRARVEATTQLAKLDEEAKTATVQRAEEIARQKETIERNLSKRLLQIQIDRLEAEQKFITSTLETEKLTEKQRIDLLKRQKEIISEISNLKAEQSKQSIDDSLRDLELTEEQIEKQKELEEARQKALDDYKKAQQEAIRESVKLAQTVNDIFDQISEKRIAQIDREIEAVNRRENDLREAIEKGSDLAGESLTDLDEERRRLEDQKAKEQENQARRELFIAGATVLAQTGSVAQAGAQLSQLKAIVDALAQFHDGGYTGDGDEWQAAGIVHKGEHVITKEQTNKYGLRHLSADDFDRAVESGYFTQFANPDYLAYDQLRPTVSTTLDQTQVINRLERVEDAILLTIEKKPEHRQEWDEMRKEMVYELKTRNKVERKRRKGFRY